MRKRGLAGVVDWVVLLLLALVALVIVWTALKPWVVRGGEQTVIKSELLQANLVVQGGRFELASPEREIRFVVVRESNFPDEPVGFIAVVEDVNGNRFSYNSLDPTRGGELAGLVSPEDETLLAPYEHVSVTIKEEALRRAGISSADEVVKVLIYPAKRSEQSGEVVATDAPLATGTSEDEGESRVSLGQGLFGMSVLSVEEGDSGVSVVTTGAIYNISADKIELWRRIDPATNDVNPRLVGEIDFDSGLSNLELVSADGESVRVESDEASFEFYPDSFFIITAKQEISYTHENLISSPPWSRTGERNTDRMWTDGFGGSLHAWLNGDVATPSSDASSTSLELQPNARMGHMVFPPKPFDFEGLYGENARPFVIFRYTPAQLESLINNAETYKNDGFGVVVLWNYFYEPPCYNPPPDGQHPCYNDTTSSPEMFFPKQLDKSTSPWVPYDGIFGYEYKDPDLIKNFVRDAHRHGFKVLGYFSSPEFDPELSAPRHNGYARISHQSINDTLAFMRAFQREYNLDGWYLDNAQISRDLNLTYNFVKQVRKDIGDDGILYHHNSLDPWDGFDQVNGVGNYNGLRAVMIDAYVNYNLAGETGEIAEIDSPNDPYFRFYTSGYGITQTYSAHILATNKRSSMSVDEVNRLMAQNLHGVQRNRLSSWLNYFKPFYDEQKEKYLDGTLSFAPDWPIDSQGWFRSPTNVQITKLSPTEVQISWETDSVSDGNVTYTSNGAWWPPRGPDGSVRNDTLTTEHFVNISGLDPGTEYEFRIRSSNRAANVKDEIIWGYVGSFKISDL